MLSKSRVFKTLTAICLTLAVTFFAFADTIKLKDGSIIKGRIVSFADGKFTVVIGEGPRQRQMFFFADEVDSIEFDGTTGISTIRTQLPTRTETPQPTPSPSRTVVITDSTRPTSTPTPVSTPVPTPTPRPTSTPVPTPVPTPQNRPRPIVVNVKVLADNTANGWTNSQWVVKKGQKIRITARGQVNLGGGRFSSPSGIATLADKDKLIPTEPTGGLIAVIGDDNNDFLFIGAAREFVAQRDGSLFLGVNEGNLDDNSGAFEVTIEIEP